MLRVSVLPVKSMLAPVLHCAAICSRKEEMGRAMADAFGIETVCTWMEDMEPVYVASPNGLHYAQTRAALEAGKHVIKGKGLVPLRGYYHGPLSPL